MELNYSKNVLQKWGKSALVGVLCSLSCTAHLFANTGDEKISELSSYASEQKKKSINGTVIDAVTKEPVIGALITVKGTTVGTSSNVDGTYSFSYSNTNPVLSVSFIGYKTVEKPIGSETTINFALEEDSFAIEEVVVVAGGQQRKESVIGAITNVNVGNLALPVAKLSTALAGQLAGIVSVQNSGEPGSSAEFYIRGIATFGANKTPLVLVDGVERTLDLVDTEDIASFSILKDASATAVYGVRGANGVILIQTKKGAPGRPTISVKYEHGLLTPIKRAQLANSTEFATLYNEAVGYDYYSQKHMDQYAMPKDAVGRDNNLYPDVDWLGELFKNVAQNQRVNVGVSGGGEIARYYIAGSFYNEGSIFKQDAMANYQSAIRYQKTNFRANVDVNLFPTTELNVKIANIFEKQNEPGGGKGTVWDAGFYSSPNAFPAYYTQDNGDWLAWSGPQYGTGSNPYNVLMNSGYKEIFSNSTQSSIGLTQTFGDAIPGLTARINYSWDAWNYQDVTRSKTVTQYIANGRDEDGNLVLQETVKGGNSLGYSTSRGGAGDYARNGTSTYLEATLNYNKTFGKNHHFSAMFLYNHKIKTFVGVSSDAAGAKYLSLPYKNQGIAARATYDYANRYFVEINAGYNGSENFSPGKRFGLFPAVAAGWIMSNEKFMESISDKISLVKLKGSYGIVGSDQIGGSRRFIYNPTINEGAGGYDGMGENGDYNPGGIAVGDVANPNVSWEEAKKLNAGIELGFMNNALRIDANYFNEQRSGIFMERKALPGMSGINAKPYVNVGEMKNAGFDGSIEYFQNIGEFEVTARGNFTYSHNIILNNDEPDWNYKYRNRIGKSSGQNFGLISEGLFRDELDIASSPRQTYGNVRPGDIKYRDVNGDGRIDDSDMVAIGFPALPEIVYGFGATGNWRGISLSVFFQGIGHSNIFISGRSLHPFEAGNVQQSSFNKDIVDGIWRLSNPDVNARYPRVSLASNGNNTATSTHWMRDRSYLRLKNAEIGYSLPKRIVQKMQLKQIRVYAQGVNLVTFSKFKLWDPENGGGQGAAYPLNTTISLGLQITY